MLKRSVILCVPALVLLAALGGFAQGPGKTVLDGVYTSAQAARGHANYVEHCEKCHGGSEPDASPIMGDEFVDRWREDSLAPLLTFMKTKMPGDSPGKFEEAFYVDVISYLLEETGYREGSSELTAADAGNILLVGRDGPKPLPNQALVLTAGCLTPGANGAWTLTNVGRLSRTKEGDHTNPEELKASAARPLGTQTFQLRNLDIIDKFNPDDHKGHKMQVKGVYSQQTAGPRLSVTSIEMLASTCTP